MEWCGLYICVANICEMMRSEKQVDVMHTILNVRHSLPHFLTDQVNYSNNIINNMDNIYIIYAVYKY